MKLSELKALRSKMTPGLWLADGWKGQEYDDVIYTDNTPGIIAETSESDHPTEDAAGIVATHNMMDLLIEVVEKALILQQAKFNVDKINIEDVEDNSVFVAELAKGYIEIDAAKKAFNLALSKVPL
jgi:hypothetical protein